ncbi:MAG: hypothetical protein MJY98_03590 [Fibrobacter sp.]|nr:hypothetical protein [Fibrobacter sp.]
MKESNKSFFDRIMQDLEIFKKNVDEYHALLGSDLLGSLHSYLYYDGKDLDVLTAKENSDFLFGRSTESFGPIFKKSDSILNGNKKVYANSKTCGAFLFNHPDCVTKPIVLLAKIEEIDSKEIKEVFNSNGKRFPLNAKCYDFEIFEKRKLKDATRNFEMKSLFDEFEYSSEINSQEMKDLAKENIQKNLEGCSFDDVQDYYMFLDDIEKLHIKFVYDGKIMIPIYIGIGTNNPFELRLSKASRLSSNGEDRYRKFDLLNSFDETMVLKGKNISLEGENDELLWLDEFVNGKQFALFDNKVVYSCRKNPLEYDQKRLENGEIKKIDKDEWKEADLGKEKRTISLNDALNFDWQKYLNIFPEYEEYRQVFFSPTRIINCLSISSVREHLKKKGLIGLGTSGTSKQAVRNIASDLYMNGMDDTLRLKPTILLFLSLYNKGVITQYLEEFTRNANVSINDFLP